MRFVLHARYSCHSSQCESFELEEEQHTHSYSKSPIANTDAASASDTQSDESASLEQGNG